MKKLIIEKLGIDTETKVITNDAWSGCGGCTYFIIDKDEPLFCGIDHHICSLNEDDNRRDDCFKDAIIYVKADLSDKEKIFNEMLEALILVMDERFTGIRKSTTGQLAINTVEKACYPKTWEEIKELIK